jgi:hypothetical protein
MAGLGRILLENSVSRHLSINKYSKAKYESSATVILASFYYPLHFLKVLI